MNRTKNDCKERGCSISGGSGIGTKENLVTLENESLDVNLYLHVLKKHVVFQMEFLKMTCQHMYKFGCGTCHRVTLVTCVQSFENEH